MIKQNKNKCILIIVISFLEFIQVRSVAIAYMYIVQTSCISIKIENERRK